MNSKTKPLTTHTVRAKSSPHPIFTLSPKFFALILEAEPEASSLALAWFTKAYSNLTGKTPSLDHEQEAKLLERYGARADGSWTPRTLPYSLYLIDVLFRDGLLSRTSGMSFEQALDTCTTFYTMLFRELSAR